MLNSALLVGLSQLFTRGSIILSTAILSRSLSAAEFANYIFFLITTTMFASYAASGIGVSATKFFAQIKKANTIDYPPIGLLYVGSILLAAITSIILIAIPINWLSGPLEISRVEIISGTLIMTAEIIPKNAIIGLEKYKENAAIALVSLATVLAGAAIASDLRSYRLAVYTILTAHAIRIVLSTVVISKNISYIIIFSNIRLSRYQISKVTGLTGPMALVTLLAASGTWLIGRIILLNNDGGEGFRQFAVALQWYSLALFGPGIVAQITLPRLIAANVEIRKYRQDASRHILKSIKYATLVSAITALLGSLLSPWISSYYGNVFASHPHTISYFLFAAIFVAPANIIGNALIASNQQWYWLGASFVHFSSLLMLAYVTSSQGAVSAAIALGGAGAILTSASYIRARTLRLLP